MSKITDCIDSGSNTDCDSFATGSSTDLDAPLRPLYEERNGFRSNKQKSNRRSYVAMTPHIVPGARNESPVTTWGRVDGTPLVLAGCDETVKFSLFSRKSSKTERECAARKAELFMARRVKLASSSSSLPSKSKKRRTKIDTKWPYSLTPAALSLLKKTNSIRPKSGSAFVSALRTSYTPQLHPSLSSSLKHTLRDNKKGRRDHVYNATPQT